jgi:periplasmic divalent cation tolerance protein
MVTTTDNLAADGAQSVRVVFCTCPDEAAAGRLASGLVEERLAACVNILPAIRSIYAWRGEVQDEAETLMIIKTTRASYPSAEAWLREHHPYEVPEVLSIRVEDGLAAYLDWVGEAVCPDKAK